MLKLCRGIAIIVENVPPYAGTFVVDHPENFRCIQSDPWNAGLPGTEAKKRTALLGLLP